MKIFYFTSTGNSLYIAKSIASDNTKLFSIASYKDTGEITDDVIGFVFPVYFFSLPNIVANFISKHQFKADYYFAIATCGSKHGSSLSQVKDLLKVKNIDLNYSNKIDMVDNYLPLYKIEDEKKFLFSKEIVEHLREITKDIKTRTNSLLIYPLANVSALLVKPIKAITLKNYAKNIVFSASKCKKCDICRKVCPVGNITRSGDGLKFNKKCIACLGCVHHCPAHALTLKKQKSELTYRHDKININDIILSNNQG
jgi:ferredoxin